MQVPIAERRWGDAPLAVIVDRFLGPLESDYQQPQPKDKKERITTRWKQAFKSWKRCDALQSSNEHSQAFRESLSAEQSASLRALQQWLRADYQPKHLASAALQVISAEQFQVPEAIDPFEAPFPPEAKTNQSIYHSGMGRLFRCEFTLLDWDWHEDFIKLVTDMLQSTRQRALYLATTQEIAWKFYRSNTEELQNCTKPLYTALPHRAACPWITTGEKAEELPYYLWDIGSQRTVRTRDLDNVPDYTCISHTWGRWPKLVPCAVKGVPWKVPQNRIFDICDMPQLFHDRRAQFSTKYIWFDLFCIPQVQETLESVELARQEIARQARIFGHAIHCVAWFSYIPTWRGEMNALSWICHRFLALTSAPGLLNFGGSKINAGEPIRFLESPIIDGVDPVDLPDAPPGFEPAQNIRTPWFSSLWTLQEMFLRPDMLLMNKRFEPLCSPDGLMLSLDHLLCLINTTIVSNSRYVDEEHVNVQRDESSIAQYSDPVPRGARQLIAWSTQCNLSKSSYGASGPTQILVLANERECTGRRAEAIMSILDVTDWFTSSPVDDALVLGAYPLSFLKEAASKLGPDFYYSLKYLGPEDIDACLRELAVKGSMLPFEEVLHGQLRGRLAMDSLPIHQTSTTGYREATSEWHIQADGSVWVQQAAVLGTNDLSLSPPEDCMISIFTLNRDGEGMGNRYVDLKTWLENQKEDEHICLSHITPEHGILLKGLKGREGGAPQRMVKIGCFLRHTAENVINSKLPDVVTVNYLVV